MEALFLPAADGGSRFVLLNEPVQAPVRATALYVAPFAEEMNKTRRMAAMQARALAAAGVAVLQLDLAGCGDSSGEFDQARWLTWIDDIVAASHWLAARHPHALPWLWGARAGCLLVAEAARHLPAPPAQLWWAPVLQGKTHLAQFLRIRAAAEMLQGGPRLDLKAELEAGRPVDIAGYRLAPELARSLGEARLAAPLAACRLVWLEVDSRADAHLAPAAGKLLAELRDTGLVVDHARVNGPAFWQTTEIEEAPELLRATTHALCAASACPAP